jgi:hypothetical protein
MVRATLLRDDGDNSFSIKMYAENIPEYRIDMKGSISDFVQLMRTNQYGVVDTIANASVYNALMVKVTTPGTVLKCVREHNSEEYYFVEIINGNNMRIK